jgi:peptidoglycan hydrolase-like protein with peptidoglycan-binding domain
MKPAADGERPATGARRRSFVVPVAWVTSVAIALGTGWLAATAATEPPQASIPEPTAVVAEVAEGTVSEHQDYGVVARWPTQPVGINTAVGTLTSIAVEAGGTLVDAGDTVYTVDLAPVIVARGAVPSFRTLQQGVRGEDVAQLQRLLIDLGHLDGTADGAFGAATRAAVQRWNASMGFREDSTVPIGRLVFVPQLPTRLAPAEGTAVGMQLTTGAFTLVGAASTPDFSFSVLPEMLEQVAEGMPVRIDGAGHMWEAEVSHLAIPEDDAVGATVAVLRPVEGVESICGDACGDAVALGARTVLRGELILVPETRGTVVPTSAISTDASGATAVSLAGGGRVAVDVLASADGRSVVRGVSVGDLVVVVPQG